MSISSATSHALHISFIDSLRSHPVNPTPAPATSRDNGAAVFQSTGAPDFVAEVVLCAVRMNSLGFGGSREKRECGGDKRNSGDCNKHWMIPPTAMHL